MQDGLPYILPIIFTLSIVIVLLIYWFGGKTAAKGSLKTTHGKKATYACGEDFPVEEVRVDLERFFVFAVYFLIFDVLAFILATSFYTTGLIPIVYSLIVLAAVATLLLVRGARK